MIIHNACRLNMGIYYYAAQEFEAPFFHIRRNPVRQFRPGRYFAKGFPFAFNLFAFGKTPDIVGETAEFFLHSRKCLALFMEASIFSRLRTIP